MVRVSSALLCSLFVACGIPSEPAPAPDAGDTEGPEDAGESCTPKSCSELGAECGAPDDGCGNALECGSCPAGPCGEDYTCSCEPESDDAFCKTHRARCGSLTNLDICGASRTVDCGSCPFGECGLEGTPNLCGFVDARDGNKYGFVTIGTQTWMSQNLNYQAAYSYCALGVDPDPNPCSKPKYGRYYTWRVATQDAASSNAVPSGVRGVCPEGWHLPSRAEWEQLATFVAQEHGAQPHDLGWLIARRLQWVGGDEYNWADHDARQGGSPTDDYGFSLRPAGVRSAFSTVTDRGTGSYTWSATEDGADTDNAFWFVTQHVWDGLQRIANTKDFAASVRCVKD